MSEPASSTPFYVAGGTLRPGTPSYVVRRADTELYERLQAGGFCYVLTPRQMGKSSLMARTAKKLESEGVRTVTVDLTQIGGEKTSLTPESWYFGVVHEIHRQLRLPNPLRPWWQEQEGLPALQKLTRFLRDVVLESVPDRVVIFVDEIDSTIGLPFADDFFAAIRACYNARATDSAFERLTFALFGVASPDQLIQDPARTPFNIGQRIDLTDFTQEEARLLATGLHEDSAEAKRRLERVLHWTGGHPYLTQALCAAAGERTGESSGAPEAVIDPLVEDLFLSARAQREETNLKHAHARLAQVGSQKRRILALYLRVLRGQPIPDEPASSLFAQLKLSAIVKVTESGILAVRNRIYERVFSASWAKAEISANRTLGVAAGTLAASLLLNFAARYGVVSPLQKEQLLSQAVQGDSFPLAREAYPQLQADALMARATHRLKMMVYLLGIASIAGLVFSTNVSLQPLLLGAGPSRDLPPFDQMSPGAIAVILFTFCIPFALLPAGLGYALWHFVVRQRVAVVEREATMAAVWEKESQALLDSLLQRFASQGEDVPADAKEARAWALALREPLKGRLFQFLAALLNDGMMGGDGIHQPVLAVVGEERTGRGARAFSFSFVGVNLFSVLWCGAATAMMAQGDLFSTYVKAIGLQVSQRELLLAGFNCSEIALVLFLGGLGLLALLRREEREWRRRESLRDHARSVCVDSWVDRIAGLANRSGEDHQRTLHLVRACILTALAELTPPWKGEFVARLRQANALTQPLLQGLSLRGTHLSGIDLSDVFESAGL